MRRAAGSIARCSSPTASREAEAHWPRGKLRAGDALLADGKLVPTPGSVLNGQNVPWRRVITAGGTHLFGGDKLFTAWPPIDDRR